jgi:hypothetical protein
MLAAEKHAATFMAPLVIGLTLFACHLLGILFVARSLSLVRSMLTLRALLSGGLAAASTRRDRSALPLLQLSSLLTSGYTGECNRSIYVVLWLTRDRAGSAL